MLVLLITWNTPWMEQQVCPMAVVNLCLILVQHLFHSFYLLKIPWYRMMEVQILLIYVSRFFHFYLITLTY